MQQPLGLTTMQVLHPAQPIVCGLLSTSEPCMLCVAALNLPYQSSVQAGSRIEGGGGWSTNLYTQTRSRKLVHQCRWAEENTAIIGVGDTIALLRWAGKRMVIIIIIVPRSSRRY